MTVHICEDAVVERWNPDFSSSGQRSPIWHRVVCGQRVITNSLEWVGWGGNPVQVILCDACGHPGCASGGYVHLSRLAEYVLLTSPQTDASCTEMSSELAPRFLRTLGAIAIDGTTWNNWSDGVPQLVKSEQLERANHAAVADAWLLGPARHRDTLLNYLTEKLLAGDTLDRGVLVELVSNTVAIFDAKAKEPFDGPVLSLSLIGARLETLYFDGPHEIDWPAFAFKGDQLYLALDREHVTILE